MSTNEKIFKDRLFPRLEKHKYQYLQIDAPTMSYITTPHNAKLICKIIKQYFDKNNVKMESIVDATACVGGDTIALSKTFKEVLASEIDIKNFKMLENNVKVYRLNNVRLYNEDCLKLLSKIDYVQAVYFDPPWGGSDYKNHDNLHLTINNESIEKISIDLILRKYCKRPPRFIIFKLPKNYDLQYFFKTVSIKDEIKIYLHKLKKIDIIVIVNIYTDNEHIVIE
jgi:16S rRNA G966 N2-methylase RsmD